MVTSPSAVFASLESVSVTSIARERTNRRRRISFEAGHALEKLGHAIDYLADEYVHEGGNFDRNDPKLQAVEMLMAINRRIYFACPEIPTLGERLDAWLSGQRL
jgi:hypothetical protein